MATSPRRRRLGRLPGVAIPALLVPALACTVERPAPGAAARPDVHVRILAVHDFHGALEPTTYPWSGGRPVGGAPALAAALDSAEARCRCPTLRLDGGDQMQGTLASNLVFGASVVDAFNRMGLDAAAVGNHELDWGLDTLVARQAQASYAWLAANVFLRGTGERPDWARPYAVVERGGVRVAVVGYATVGTPRALRAATTAGYEFREGAGGLRAALDDTRRLAPDFTVVVAHAGGDCEGRRCAGEMVELARGLEPGEVDLIVGGHDHSAGEGLVNGIRIVRAGSHARALAVVDLLRRGDARLQVRVAYDTVWVDRVDPDAGIVDLLRPHASRADALGRRPVTVFRDPLSASRGPALGQLVADALRVAADADVALQNPGGLRADLPAGSVTYEDVFRALPFGNTVVRLRVSGRQLREVLELGVAGRTFHVAGMRVRYDPRRPPGNRVLSLEDDDGRPLRDDATYALAVPDFLAEGGDGFLMLTDLPHEPTGLTILDALIGYLDRLSQPVVAPAEPRVIAERR